MSKLITLLLLSCISIPSLASEAKLENIQVMTDVQTVERGAEALMTDCHSCHSLKYIRYRDLVNYGVDKGKVDAWRGDLTMDAAVMAQMAEADSELAFGKAPPDLSLIAKAREGGASYIYSYLVGYFISSDGMLGNHYFPETKMPDVLGISGASNEKERAEIQSKARDIVAFMVWAADPNGPERIRLGYYVIAYLIVLTTLLYFVKNQVWSRLK